MTSFVSIGLINNEIPRIRPIFAMLEPMTFPRIIPVELFLKAAMEVKSSGAEVAIDTIVRPITTLGTPREDARLEQ